MLYEVWAEERLANCAIIKHDILEVCKCKLLHFETFTFLTCIYIQLDSSVSPMLVIEISFYCDSVIGHKMF